MKKPCVYLIRLAEPLPLTGNQTYLGSANHIGDRLKAHRSGSGAAFMRRAQELGIGIAEITIRWYKSEAAARNAEAPLKRMKNNKTRARKWLKRNGAKTLAPTQAKTCYECQYYEPASGVRFGHCSLRAAADLDQLPSTAANKCSFFEPFKPF